MTYWLYPANTKYYDVLSAFAKDSAYWPIKSKVEVKDKVLIYLAAPYKQIGFEAEVAQVDVKQDKILNKLRPFFRQIPDQQNAEARFMKLSKIKPIEQNAASPLGLQQLKLAGLKGMLMGPRSLDNNPDLLGYIKEHLR